MVSELTDLAVGVSGVVPTDWQLVVESSDPLKVDAITLSNATSDAQLELLNPRGLSSADFISAYSTNLGEDLRQLGFRVRELNHNALHEVRASEEGSSRIVVHFFVPTLPVGHISAVTSEERDVNTLRDFAASLKIELPLSAVSEEVITPMTLANTWQRDS